MFIGRARDIKAGLSRSLPTAYEGCMSGAKAIYQPHATTTKRFRKSIELDFFKMMDEQKLQDNNQQRNPTGDLPATECGSTLRTPGKIFILLLHRYFSIMEILLADVEENLLYHLLGAFMSFLFFSITRKKYFFCSQEKLQQKLQS